MCDSSPAKTVVLTNVLQGMLDAVSPLLSFDGKCTAQGDSGSAVCDARTVVSTNVRKLTDARQRALAVVVLSERKAASARRRRERP